MLGFLQLWALLGTCTLIVEIVRLHRRGTSLRALCASHAELAAQGGDLARMHALFGHRPIVIIVTVGLFPLVWAVEIAGRLQGSGR